MKLSFHVLNSHLKGLTLDTEKERVTIGRSSDNDLALKQHSISRRHAVIVQDGEMVTLEDIGSKNATEVDGVAIDGITEIRNGAILTFGDVALQINMPELEESPLAGAEEITGRALVSAPTETAAAGYEADLPGGSGESAVSARAADEAVSPGAPRGIEKVQIPETENRVWGLLAAVLGIGAAVVIAFFFLNYTGATDRAAAEIGTSLRVGEVKIVEVPTGFVHNLEVYPPDLARVTRSLNLNIAVTVEAISQGMATATLYNSAGDRVLLHINVLPGARSGPVDHRPMSHQEREAAAREIMLSAESLRLNGRHYEAMKLYEEVVELLHPLGAATARLQRNAENRRIELEALVTERHQQLFNELSDFVRLGKKRQALARLEDIMELIPDDGDLRHQNASVLHRMLVSMLEREGR